VAAADADPPSTDELGIRTFATYASGMERLWTDSLTASGTGHRPGTPGRGSLEGGEEGQ
jgi:hypothetical protein